LRLVPLKSSAKDRGQPGEGSQKLAIAAGCCPSDPAATPEAAAVRRRRKVIRLPSIIIPDAPPLPAELIALHPGS
jgi:hypothetical protein